MQTNKKHAAYAVISKKELRLMLHILERQSENQEYSCIVLRGTAHKTDGEYQFETDFYTVPDEGNARRHRRSYAHGTGTLSYTTEPNRD